jgi:hypothetical protein
LVMASISGRIVKASFLAKLHEKALLWWL